MNNKVILLLIDGLCHSAAMEAMGYLRALVEAGKAQQYKMECELPSLSRPLYECILTGVRPVDSGIVDNTTVRLSHHESVFNLASNAKLTTAAAAYHWISELYNKAPYDSVRDRFTSSDALPIQHGCFYNVDSYPDCHLMDDAECIRLRHSPHFLLIHPMNIDDAGHRYGAESAQYFNAARHLDTLLAQKMPTWFEEGYQIIVTSDHGMGAFNVHGGTRKEEREIPLFVAGSKFSMHADASPRQLELCGTICSLLNIADHGKPECKELLA